MDRLGNWYWVVIGLRRVAGWAALGGWIGAV